MLVLLAPGQGSQTPGMLTPWLPEPGVAALVERWSQAIGLDLATLGTTATSAELQPTEVAQPLLTAAALLSARAADLRPDVVVGHSVGELSALALAGVLSDDDAVALAAARGAAMSAAAAALPTGMAAVLGGELEQVQALAELAGLEVATVNAPGQVVLGGPVSALDALELPAGLRLRRLDVAGAFHTRAMAPAAPALTGYLDRLTPHDATVPVVANADGAVLTSGRELLDRLPGQLTRAVRFDLCLSALAGLGVTTAIELAPGGTLTSLVRRVLPDVQRVALKSREDLTSLADLQGVPA